jgi:hypothetical protein
MKEADCCCRNKKNDAAGNGSKKERAQQAVDIVKVEDFLFLKDLHPWNEGSLP